MCGRVKGKQELSNSKIILNKTKQGYQLDANKAILSNTVAQIGNNHIAYLCSSPCNLQQRTEETNNYRRVKFLMSLHPHLTFNYRKMKKSFNLVSQNLTLLLKYLLNHFQRNLTPRIPERDHPMITAVIQTIRKRKPERHLPGDKFLNLKNNLNRRSICLQQREQKWLQC